MGVPPNHPFLVGVSHYKPFSYWLLGYPMTMETTIYCLVPHAHFGTRYLARIKRIRMPKRATRTGAGPCRAWVVDIRGDHPRGGNEIG